MGVRRRERMCVGGDGGGRGPKEEEQVRVVGGKCVVVEV